ncbi:MAG: M23 family metallopeptidase [Leptospiraceae bacterium]|nr:M23 family metallopeptidase [Leptospiraceae bacterium]MDW8307551.1 M23 family metallopeptidase [Leptospiraceae bacterium]
MERSKKKPSRPEKKAPREFEIPTEDLSMNQQSLAKKKRGRGSYFHRLWKSLSRQLERWYLDWKALLKRKREERLTIMFIPHNERSIRNFHISNLSLTIILGVVGFLLVVSSVLVILHNSTVQEVDKMKISQKDAQIQFAKIREEIRAMGNTFQEFRDIISSLYSYAKGKEEASLFAAGGWEGGDKLAEGADIPLEVFLLERIAHDLGISLDKLKDVRDFLNKREKIIRNTPTLWPVKGYILNPFGYIRHAAKLYVTQNRGVDIASHPGAKVVATAPGVVVSITRDSRFLYTVRIRHNYGYETVYHGLDRVTVRTEEKLTKGELIGYLGLSPDSLEAVLHYEIHIGVEPVDPMPYLSFLGG